MATVSTRPEINDLSLLSLLAAHELEELERNEPSDGKYLSALREHLNQQMRPARESIKNIAPSTVQLYRRAVYEATKVDPQDYSALITALDGLLKQLDMTASKVQYNQPVGDLQPLLA